MKYKKRLFGKADKRPARYIFVLPIRKLLSDTLLGRKGLAYYFSANNKGTLHCSARAVTKHFLYLKFNFAFPAEIHMVFSEINTV